MSGKWNSILTGLRPRVGATPSPPLIGAQGALREHEMAQLEKSMLAMGCVLGFCLFNCVERMDIRWGEGGRRGGWYCHRRVGHCLIIINVFLNGVHDPGSSVGKERTPPSQQPPPPPPPLPLLQASASHPRRSSRRPSSSSSSSSSSSNRHQYPPHRARDRRPCPPRPQSPPPPAGTTAPRPRPLPCGRSRHPPPPSRSTSRSKRKRR
jgi:hypothetical protein